MRSDFAQFDLDLDLAPVELPAHLRALGLDFLFRATLEFLRGHGGLTPCNLPLLRGVLFRRATQMPRGRPDNQKTQSRARYDGADQRQEERLALENQQAEVGCAS